MSNILLFGDQTADQRALLHKVALRAGNPILRNFIERVSVVLRDEIKALPRTQRAAVPDFLTVNNLVELYFEKNCKIPIIESALVTIVQLGHFIGYFSDHPEELPASANTRSLGLCTGLLAATAAVSVKSIGDIVPLAVELVRISLRAGVAVQDVREGLILPGEEKASWSTIVTGTSEQAAKDALAAFHKEKGIALSNQAWISAVSGQALTISGPPSTTKRFFEESPVLAKNHRVPIPVFAPYHAEHLFGENEINQILAPSVSVLEAFRPASLVHSAATGKPIVAENALELARAALNEALRLPVRWDHLLEETVSQVGNAKIGTKIFSFGVSNVAGSLVSALKQGGVTNVSVIDAASWSDDERGANGNTQSDKVAIVGMAGRFPNSANHEALWDLLMKGLDVHKRIPADRFDVDAHYDPSGKGKNKSHSPFGCFIDEPGLFDPRFFNMSPREAAQTDPMGRLALVTAYEALEMSGYVPNRTPSTKLNRIGTFYGQTSDDWREINAAENVDTYYITGGVRAFGPGRINYYFKFSGPSYSVDTACSSSLAAIQLACTSLLAGDVDTAVAGGCNVLTNPDIFSGLSKGQFLSKTGSCKTYDNNADGYCRGDAVGSVIMKRYADAVADKDNILGCILGSGTNHSAEAVSITHPHAGNQEQLYRQVLANAGVDAHTISVVEMHGTGTQAGDGIEMESVTNVFAPRHRQRKPEEKLYLGAIKANIGHAEAASGVNSLIKVMLMMQNSKIPANVGIKGEINKTFPADLGRRNVHISQKMVEWPRNGAEKRRVFLNNFSAAGGNTALLLEDAPLKAAPQQQDPRGTLPITVTARSISALKRNIENLKGYFAKNPSTLTSTSYTLTARRIQHNYRIAFPLAEIDKVNDALQAQVKESYNPVPMAAAKTAFCFTGQGSQYTGLGQKLYADLKSFRDDINQLNNLARIQGLPSFLELLDGTDVQTLSPVKVQLGMACIQVALARMWASYGITPVAVIGHSLGEYAALHVAGVISAADMVLLVGRRAELLVKDCTPHTHGMLAVKGSAEAIRSALGAKMTEIACINGPEETVLCGSGEVVGAANETLTAKGFKATKLNVPFAFHSAQVDPILDAFKKVAASVTFNKPSVPVLSPLSGEIITEAGIINPEYLARHARETVNFWTALTSGQKAKIFDERTAWLEVGAHPVCSGMVKASVGATVTAPSLRRGEDAWKTISNSICTLFLAGVSINFEEFHREFNDAQELYTLPTYSFDNKKYWLDYHNNWTLTKGEAPQVKEVSVEKAVAAPAVEVPVKRISTSCQKLVSETFSADAATVVIQTNMADPKLYPVVCGHMVNNAALCPSSLYADMAYTVAEYIWNETNPGTEVPGISVCNMEVPKPLIAQIPQPAEGQHISMRTEADLTRGTMKVHFSSVKPDGTKIQDHAHCTINYEDKATWKNEWSRVDFMVKSQIERLHMKSQNGTAHKVQKGMAYKLFKALVSYDDKYRAMSEVVLDGETTEATATIKFPTTAEDQADYRIPPYHIDGSCHISGFICNASDLLDSEQSVYVSHGWGAMKFLKPFNTNNGEKTVNYVRMLDQPNKVKSGDVYILQEGEIVAVCEAIKFQEIPRRVLNTFLPPVKQSAALPAAKPIARAAPAPVSRAPAPVALKAPSPAKSAPLAVPAAKAAPKKVAAPKKAAPGGGIISKVMKILAKETEVDVSELVDDAHFENLGVDSLLSLTISAIFREELDMDIPSTLFTDCETVGAIKKYFSQFDNNTVEEPDTEDSDSDSNPPTDVPTPYEQDLSTPASSAPSYAPSDAGKPDSPIDSLPDSDVSLARHIIAQEMGVDIDEIHQDADLTEIGMDSLMSLTILGELREKTGIDIPSTFLNENESIRKIEAALGMSPKAAAPAPAKSNKATAPQLDKVNAKLLTMKDIDLSSHPSATSVLLQGNARTATTKVFLLPDGSGSATSYVSIPNIGPDVAMYGLNCPYMKTPEKWHCGLEEIALVYLAEIKRRQPTGPYHVGGWSAGGVIAYAVSQALLAQGESVAKLILLDSPNPVDLDPLPPRFHFFCNEIGLLGAAGDPKKTPSWLLPHFSMAVKNLSSYDPKPTLKPIPTFAIWCRDGVCPPGAPRPPADPTGKEDPWPMRWLMNNRTDFGSNGWDYLLGAENMKFAVTGGHHFSMVKAPHVAEVGVAFREGLDWKP